MLTISDFEALKIKTGVTGATHNIMPKNERNELKFPITIPLPN